MPRDTRLDHFPEGSIGRMIGDFMNTYLGNDDEEGDDDEFSG